VTTPIQRHSARLALKVRRSTKLELIAQEILAKQFGVERPRTAIEGGVNIAIQILPPKILIKPDFSKILTRTAAIREAGSRKEERKKFPKLEEKEKRNFPN
jgi:hypothetical protein